MDKGSRNAERMHGGQRSSLALTLPRATLFRPAGGETEWISTLVPRYQRRLREVNEAVMGVYLAGGNTRRLRGALGPLLKAAPQNTARGFELARFPDNGW